MWMWELDLKKAEHQRIDAFELWCWRRLLRVPWTARRSTQFILKEISPGCTLEGLMLKLKLQYFGYLMWRTDSLEKTLMLGGIGGRKRRGWQWMRWLDGITDSMGMSLGELRELVMDREPSVLWFMGSQRVGLSNWTELMLPIGLSYSFYYVEIISYIPFVTMEMISFYLYFVECFYYKGVLNFVKCFSCFCWDDHVVLVLYFIVMVYYINWFHMSSNLIFLG